MNAIIDITHLSDAEIDQLLGVCPFVAFVDAAADEFVGQWLPLARASWAAAYDIADALEDEDWRLSDDDIEEQASALLLEGICKALGVAPLRPFVSAEGWK